MKRRLLINILSFNKHKFQFQRILHSHFPATLVLALVFFLQIISQPVVAQLTGTKNIPGDYATLVLAIDALNTQGVGAGGVTINLIAGNPQVAPAGGYSITTLTGSGPNPIVFQGNSNIITASLAHTVGALNDAIFKMIGADWVTISGFTMIENPANTIITAASNNMTEFGVALFYTTATDGAQNNTIQNNTIDLDRTYQNTFGIYSNSTHTATAVTVTASATGLLGGNSGLKIYGNTITDVNNGIVVVGPTAAADHNEGLDIGISAPNANSITNFGTTGTFSGYANVSGSVNGILVRNTRNFNVSYNTVTSSNGGTTSGTLNGIQVPLFSNAPTGNFANTINNNSISVKSGVIAGAINGINVLGTSASVTSIININNNDFNNCGHTVAGTGAIIFITQAGTHLTQSISNNTFSNMTVNTTGSVTFISNSNTLPATGLKNVNGNSIISTFIKTGAGGTVTFFTDNGSDVVGTTNNSNNNTVSNITLTGATTFLGIGNTNGGSPTKNVNNNTLNNIIGGTSAVTGISINFDGGTTTASGNTVSNITNGGAITGMNFGATAGGGTNASLNVVHTLTGSGTGTISGIIVGGSSGTRNIFRNKVYNLENNNAAGAVNGLTISSGTLINAYNNLIGDLRTPNVSAANSLIGINITSTATSANINVYYNTVYINATSIGANFGSSAIFHTTNATSTTAALNLRNNIIVNLSTPAGTGVTAAYRRSSATLNNYGSVSNNNLFFAGPAAAPNFIFHDGTTGLQMAPFKTLVAPREALSVTEPVSSTPGAFFQSLTGASAGFLHLVNGLTTQAESGAVNIATFTDDYDADVRHGNGGYGGTGIAPDIGADEFEGIPADFTAPGISYAVIQNTSCLTDRTLSATIIDGSGVNATAGTKPRLYFKKSTDANTYVGNASIDNGWKYVEATNASSPFSFTTDYSLLQAAVISTDLIQYFVVAQDLNSTPNVGINSGIFNAQPASVNLSAPNFPLTGTINSYMIVNAGLSGLVTVGAAGDYMTLTQAGAFGLFSELNTKGISSSLIVEILDASITELGTTALNNLNYNGCSAGPYSVIIRPAATVTPLISGASTTPLIDFNGADNVTFDGSNNGTSTRDLTIRNTGTGPSIRLINDATFNTIKNSIVESQNSSAASGTIMFSTSTGTLGNSNNTISNCHIRDRSDMTGVPANAVYSSGSGGALNGSNTISNCNIFNWTNSGVLVASTGAGNNWTINPSSFYQTSARTTALIAISILGGHGHSILNNSIGGTAPNASGTHLQTSNAFQGINLSVGTISATSVQGNSIKNIRSTVSSFSSNYGIYLVAGMANIGNVSGNMIGSSNVDERFEINGDSYGIRVSSTSTVNLSNNTVNNFGTNSTPPTGQFYFGISVEGIGGVHTVVNNTVMNVTNASVPDGTFNTQTIGMNIAATGIQTVRGNLIRDVGNTSFTVPTLNNNRVWGMILSGTAAGTVVEKNILYNIYASSLGLGSRADVLTSIQSQSTSNATYSNNMVSASDISGSSDRFIFGILDLSAAPAVNSYFFNTVNVYGTATSGNPTYAFNRNSTATVNIKSNIFSNSRTGGTGFHVAIANTNASATGWTASASNYNDLYSTTSSTTAQWLGTGAGNNRDLTGWQAPQGAGTPGSGGDANSLSVAPVFVSSTDLHLTPANGSLDNFGTPAGGITTDIDGDIRSVTTPDMGADEFMLAACASASGGTATVSGPSSFCGSGTPSISASGYSSGTGSGYQWMSSSSSGNYPLSGTPVSGQTNPASLSTGLVTSTTYYWLRVVCSAGMDTAYSNLLTITITPSAAAITGPSAICENGPAVMLSETGGTGISWVWSTAENTQTISVNPAMTTTYMVTVTSTGGCTAIASKTVTVNALPAAPTITPPSAAQCAGDPAVLLTASGSSSGSTPVTFSSGAISIAIPDNSATGISHSLIASAIPVGAVVDSVIATFSITHGFDQDIIVNLEAPNGQIVNLVKGTTITTGTNFTNTRISSVNTKPAIPATGAPFTSTYRADAALSGFQLNPSPLPTTANYSDLFGTPNGTWKLRVYDDENIGTGTLTSWSIKIIYTSPATYTWTPNGPGSGLFTDPAATMVYNGGQTNTVYALPTSTTTYTATATTGAGCTSTQTVEVFVNTLQVQNNNNSGGGSLRDVIACAAPGSTITFAPALMSQTITLTTGEIIINKNLTLSGLGMLNLTVSGNNASRIFHLQPGNIFEIENMSLINGAAVTNGGAMLVEGTLFLENVLLQNNTENAVPKSMTILSTAIVEVIGSVDLKE